MDYLYENSGNILTFEQKVASQINIIKHELDLASISAKTNIHITLSDSTSLVLAFSYSSSFGSTVTSGFYVIDFEKSTDAEGNPLKIGSAGSGDGTSYFSNGSSSLASFLEAAGRAGITVSMVEQDYDTGSVKCTMASDGKKMTCHYSSK